MIFLNQHLPKSAFLPTLLNTAISKCSVIIKIISPVKTLGILDMKLFTVLMGTPAFSSCIWFISFSIYNKRLTMTCWQCVGSPTWNLKYNDPACKIHSMVIFKLNFRRRFININSNQSSHQRFNSPTPTHHCLKLSSDVGEFVFNPVQLIRS